ncbi:hypothetical protein [Neorhizobium alkalisoli]|uniref:YpeB-like protein with protease inhibitory function n=1 Tax=Neorhizobium alkalisoli TaxID=528178 RepID=A0A561QWT7_9HYPH|nr:hypothetical protein FHW37_103706 [Neorhizobium alkalisoli]
MTMKPLICAAALGLLVATPVFALDPIPGSLTYQGQQRQHLQKAPVGSSFTYDFSYAGSGYTERYIVQPDRSLKLVDRIKRHDH